MSLSIFWSASFVCEEVMLPNTPDTLARRAPLRSRASTVLAKVAGPASAVIAAISFFCSAMPRSKAGT